MRANEFLKEAEVTPYQYQDLEVAKAVAILNQHCRQSLAMVNAPLWRGFKNHGADIITMDPSTGERKSQNTSNHYTSLMSNSPYFKGWPARNKSLICSSGTSYASAFTGYGTGGLYAIFPFDGVKIAVCPEHDLWETTIRLPQFGEHFDDSEAMTDFNHWLRAKLEFPPDFAGMVAQINNPNSAACQYAARFRIKPDQILPILWKALSPAKAGFKLLTIQQYAANHPDDKECWIGGPVVAIKEDMYDRFKDAVNARQ